MKNGTFPGQLGHHPGVGSSEANMNFMLIASGHGWCSFGEPDAAATKPKDVEVGRRTVGRKIEDRAFGGELRERGQVAAKSANSRGFKHVSKVQGPMSTVSSPTLNLDFGRW